MTRAQNKTWYKKLYDQFRDVRKEASRFSAKEINHAIDKAVKIVRRKRLLSIKSIWIDPSEIKRNRQEIEERLKKYNL